MTITPSIVQESITGDRFWLHEGLESKIVKIATEKGYLRRLSQTQIEWTSKGVDWCEKFKKLSHRPNVVIKHTGGDWEITGETSNMIIVKAILANGKKRTVAKIPFTTDAQEEHFGMSDHFDAKLIKNAPKLKMIAEMYFDKLRSDGLEHELIGQLVSGVLHDINQ